MLTCGFDEPQLCIHKPKFLALYLCTKLKIMLFVYFVYMYFCFHFDYNMAIKLIFTHTCIYRFVFLNNPILATQCGRCDMSFLRSSLSSFQILKKCKNYLFQLEQDSMTEVWGRESFQAPIFIVVLLVLIVTSSVNCKRFHKHEMNQKLQGRQSLSLTSYRQRIDQRFMENCPADYRD